MPPPLVVFTTPFFVSAPPASAAPGDDTYASTIIAASPIAWYRMNETFACFGLIDDSGNGNDGTFSGASVLSASGIPGAGSNLAQTVGSTILNTHMFMASGILTCASAASPKTIECWYKGTENIGPLVVGRAVAGNPVNGLYIGNAGISSVSSVPKYLVRDDGGGGLREVTASISTTTFINDNEWHHIVAVLGGGGAVKGMQIYVDGELGSSVTHVKGTSTTTTLDRIGNDGQTEGLGPHQSLDGIIDEVAIYDFALSSSQILDHWGKGGGGLGDLYAQWDFSDITTLFQDDLLSTPVTTDGQSIGSVSDKSGNGRSIRQPTEGNKLIFQTAEQNGLSVGDGGFGTANRWLDASAIGLGDVTGPLTIFAVAQIRSSTPPNGFGTALFDGVSGGGDAINYSLAGNGTGAGMRFGTNSGQTNSVLHPAWNEFSGEWFVIIIESDTTTQSLYIDNVFDVSRTAEGLTDGFRIGHDSNLGGADQGDWASFIGEIRIYEGEATSIQRKAVFDELAEKWGICPEPSNYVADVLADGPMGYWQLNDLGDVAVDSSGNGRDGTYVFPAGGLQRATGPFGVSDCAVDTTAGTGNYISIADNAFDSIIGAPNQSWTFEIWVDSASTPALEALIDKTDITGPINWNIMQIRIGATAGQIDAQTWDGSTNPSILSGSSIHGTGWRHVVITRATISGGDGADELRVYVDGVFLNSGLAPGSMDTSNAINLSIGSREDGTDRTLTALYAHAAVYASALTTARILSHFTTGTTNP